MSSDELRSSPELSRSDRPGDAAASAARRATADPDRFLIPTEHVPPGFGERVDSRDPPATPRAASTVVLLREGPGSGGPEALLLRRPRRSSFAADAWVFPGGAVDEADRDPALPVLCDGPDSAEWADRLRIASPEEAVAYVIAALREAAEEVGILLARKGIGEAEKKDAEEAARVISAYREPLLAGAISLREIAARESLRYALDRLVYIAHWITPEPEPRRFDTRFFLAPVPAGQDYTLHGSELVEARWLSPEEAVEGFRTGELKMLPPTVHTLRRLAGFDSVAALLENLRDAPVPAILPRMRRVADGVEIQIMNDQ